MPWRIIPASRRAPLRAALIAYFVFFNVLAALPTPGTPSAERLERPFEQDELRRWAGLLDFLGLKMSRERLAELYRSVDGFLVVSGEYNHGIPPALKNLLDHFLEEYFWRPSGIVCYSAGGFGGVRAAMQLRMTLAELGMPSIPSILPIPRISETIDEDGVAGIVDSVEAKHYSLPESSRWRSRSTSRLAMSSRLS